MERRRKIKILQDLLKVSPGYLKEEDLNPFMPARIIEELHKNMEKEVAELKKKVDEVKSDINRLEYEILREIS